MMTITDEPQTNGNDGPEGAHSRVSETGFGIHPQSPTIGAEISGIDLGGDLPEEMIDDLRAALLEWKVLFFRDQDITTEQHIAFSRRFSRFWGLVGRRQQLQLLVLR